MRAPESIDDLMRRSIPVDRSVHCNAATITEVVPRDAGRVSLILSCGSGVPVFWMWSRQPAPIVGLVVPQAAAPLALTLRDHGALVIGPVWAFIPTGGQVYWAGASAGACPCGEPN